MTITRNEEELLECRLKRRTTSIEKAIRFFQWRFPGHTVEKVEHVFNHSAQIKKPVSSSEPVCIVGLPNEFEHGSLHRPPYEERSLNKFNYLWVLPPGGVIGYINSYTERRE